ncbi:MAG: endonuclease III [candidate division KSB1 bacterium]|nr:endonuclease III [candidate division KSB1 bacterium]MDZ7302150.1 endonuclease III [candidate division KSB1 bacterium]MDZ7311260.1 endonuclease III [candidate division KSB1 bacterium]
MQQSLLHFSKTIAKIRRAIRPLRTPAVTSVAEKTRNPFRVLISCLISLRTKDEVTAEASRRLFARADTPAKMLQLREREIARLIFPAGFYRTKAKRILEISRELTNGYDGRVPDTLDALLKLKGVGRKTANLVLTVAFGKPGICVDTHVHRISNRLGWVKTKTPEQTEMALRKILPKRHWISINDRLVTFGQNICQPVSPRCSKCPLEKDCPKIGVRYRR